MHKSQYTHMEDHKRDFSHKIYEGIDCKVFHKGFVSLLHHFTYSGPQYEILMTHCHPFD